MSDTPMRVLSVIPPMTQLNTPYPSTAYLTGFLRSRGVDAVQEDLALALVLRLLSREGLGEVRRRIEANPGGRVTVQVQGFLDQFDRYAATIDRTIDFLQGRDPTLAHRINSRAFLPEGTRFASLEVYVDEDGGDPLAWAFGALVDWIHEAGRMHAAGELAGVVLNAGAYTHTSVALLDAIKGTGVALIELHISNVHARESFRHHSYIASAAKAVMCGFGVKGYGLAIDGLAGL